jgi:aspartyl-tRNA(Asn)/glutamyl-tRNA(Gln) amidotransferase subunit C
MSTLDQEFTKKIAKLARIKLKPEEVAQYTKDLEKILGYVHQLSEVNTEGVEPMIHGIPLPMHFREDKAEPLGETEIQKILSCSEQVLYDQYKVPQVIGEAQ